MTWKLSSTLQSSPVLVPSSSRLSANRRRIKKRDLMMSNSQSSSWLPNLKVTKITTLPASATFLRATAWYLERSTTQEMKCLKTLPTYPKQLTPTRSQVTKWSLLGKPPTPSTPKDTWALATATRARFLCGIYSRTWLLSLQATHLGSCPPVVSLQPMMQALLTSFTWASANCW